MCMKLSDERPINPGFSVVSQCGMHRQELRVPFGLFEAPGDDRLDFETKDFKSTRETELVISRI